MLSYEAKFNRSQHVDNVRIWANDVTHAFNMSVTAQKTMFSAHMVDISLLSTFTLLKAL